MAADADATKARMVGRHGVFACGCCHSDTAKRERRATKRRERQAVRRATAQYRAEDKEV